VSYELHTIKGDTSSELVKYKSTKSYFQSNFLGKSGHIRPPKLGYKGVCQTCPTLSPDMSEVHIFSRSLGLSRPFAGFQRGLSDMFGHIWSTLPPTAKSFHRTCLGHSLSSRGDHRTYPVPGSDMSGPSALTRVNSLHYTCLVPRPGSSNVSRTYLVSWPNMFGSLTPQRADSMWGL
jgi:hypothetical protein